MKTPFTIVNCAIAMDGGSLSLLLNDNKGIQHTILIPQFLEPINFTSSRPPGSLIFDGKVVDVRGEEEIEIVNALKTENIIAEDIEPNRFHNNPHVETSSDIKEFMSGSINKVMEQTVNHIINFIESEKYIKLAISQKRYR